MSIRTHSVPAWAVMAATVGALLALSWVARRFSRWMLAVYSLWMERSPGTASIL